MKTSIATTIAAIRSLGSVSGAIRRRPSAKPAASPNASTFPVREISIVKIEININR